MAPVSSSHETQGGGDEATACRFRGYTGYRPATGTHSPSASLRITSNIRRRVCPLSFDYPHDAPDRLVADPVLPCGLPQPQAARRLDDLRPLFLG